MQPGIVRLLHCLLCLALAHQDHLPRDQRQQKKNLQTEAIGSGETGTSRTSGPIGTSRTTGPTGESGMLPTGLQSGVLQKEVAEDVFDGKMNSGGYEVSVAPFANACQRQPNRNYIYICFV